MATIATRVEFAFGANLAADPATWTWTDVSRFAVGTSVKVTPGRPDEANTTTPTRCVFRLRNSPLPGGSPLDNGRFTPRFPASPFWPNVRRQTPVRVSMNPGTGFAQRFQGSVDEFVPQWLSSNTDYAEVEVTASGSLRREGQGNKLLRSAAYREFGGSSPSKYWPMEEGQLASAMEQVGGTVPSLQLRSSSSQPVVFAGVTPQPGCGPMPNFAAGGSLSFPLRGTDPNAWTVEFAFNFGAGEPSIDSYSSSHPEVNVFEVFNTTAPTGWTRWEFEVAPHNATYPNGLLGLQRFDNGTSDFDFVVNENLPANFNPWDGLNHHIGVRVVKNGGSVDWYLYVDGAQFRNGTLARAYTIADNAVVNGAPFISSQMPYGVGHVLFHDGAYTPPSSHGRAVQGWIGETATDRMIRLCAEQGVPLALTGTSGTAMGPQGVATFLNLLRECETADIGILYDGAGPGLSYLARSSRYNLPVSLALDCLRQQVKLPFTPSEDDLLVRNDWTITRPDGSFAQFTDPVHIAANGLYDDGPKVVNVQADADLRNQAAWRVHLGTVEEMRVPGLSLQLIDRPELWAAWLATTLGERVTAQNLPPQYPPGILDMIVEGYTETWNATSWKINLNTSPYRPWIVGALNTSLRLELAGQTLAANLVPGATTLILATAAGHQLFTLKATYPNDFPPNNECILGVAGWPIRVINATGAGSPQTLTIDPSPNTSTIPAGTPVTLWRPAALAL